MSEPDNTSRYDNFLNFLDEANTQSDASAMSPLTLQSQESSKFVDIMSFLTESESNRGDDVSRLDKRANNSWNSARRNRENGRGSGGGQDGSNSNSEAISRAAKASIDEISAKVNAMKLELHEKSLLIKARQAEYKHIRSSREKKIEKLRAKWEKQLKEARAEFDSSLQSSVDMRSQVEAEIKNYETKGKALVQRLETSKVSKQEVVENMNRALETQLRRAKRQLEEEESKRFEREASSRLESMKRSAREHYAPELEKTVAQNKQKAQSQAAENEIRYTKLKRALQLDYDRKLSEARETIKQYLKNHEVRCREAGESKIAAFGRQLEEELDLVKDKYKRQMATMEETAEKAARKQLDTHLASVAKLNSSEQSAMEQLLKKQSVELHTVSEGYSKQQHDWAAQYEVQLKHLESTISDQIATEQEDQLEKQKVAVRGQISIETEQMLMKVRDEINSERNKLRDSLDQDLTELRLKQGQSMEELSQTEEKARNRFKLTTQEYEECKAEKAELLMLSERQNKQLSELRLHLNECRISLRNVEEEEATANMDNNLTVDKRVKDNEYVIREWQDKVADAESALEQVGPEYDLKKQNLINRLQEERQRIEDKIAQVLSKKNSAIEDLRDRRQDLRVQNNRLQELVDERRKRQLSSVP